MNRSQALNQNFGEERGANRNCNGLFLKKLLGASINHLLSFLKQSFMTKSGGETP